MPPCQRLPTNSRRGEIEINCDQPLDGHTQREARRDDRTRRSAAHQVEIIGEAKSRVATRALPQNSFDAFEECQGHDAAHTAAVDCENALRARFADHPGSAFFAWKISAQSATS